MAHGAAILVPLLTFVYVTKAWWMPGLISGDDFWGVPPRSEWMLANMLPWPPLWDPTLSLGQDLTAWLPSFPLWAVCAVLAHVGFHWNAIERIVYLYPLTIVIVLAPYCLAYRFTRSRTASSAAALVFCLNTWTIGLIQRGHIPSLVAASLMPFALLTFLRLRSVRPWSAVGCSLVVAAQIVYDIRYAYITLALYGCIAVAWVLARRSGVRERAGVAGVNGGIILLTIGVLSLYWIPAVVLFPGALVGSVLNGTSLETLQSFSSIWHAVALYYPFYRYVVGTNPFGVDSIEAGLYAITLVAIFGLSVMQPRRLRIAVCIAALAGIVLIAGDNSMLGPAVSWLLLHVPGMKMFRDTTKFFGVVALAYAISVAFAIAWLTAKLAGKPLFLRSVIGVLLIVYLVLMHDAFYPMRGSNFAVLAQRPQDRAITALIDRDARFTRTMFVPAIPLTLLSTLDHPFFGLGDLRNTLPPSDPSATFQEYLKSPVLPLLLEELNVRRVVLSDDTQKFMFHRFGYGLQYQRTLALLRRLPWLREEARIGRYVVFDTVAKPAGEVSAATTPAMLFGGPENIGALATSSLWRGRPGIVDTGTGEPRLSLSEISRYFPNLADGLWLTRTAPAPGRTGLQTRADPRYEALVFPVGAYAEAAPEVDSSSASARFTTRGTREWRAIATLAPGPASGFVAASNDASGQDEASYWSLFPSSLDLSMDVDPLLAVSVANLSNADDRKMRYEMDLTDAFSGRRLVVSGEPIRDGDLLVCDLFRDLNDALTSKVKSQDRLYAENFMLRAVKLYSSEPLKVDKATIFSDQNGESARLAAVQVSRPSTWVLSPAAGVPLASRDFSDGRSFVFLGLRQSESARRVAKITIPLGLSRARLVDFDLFLSDRLQVNAWLVLRVGGEQYLVPATSLERNLNYLAYAPAPDFVTAAAGMPVASLGEPAYLRRFPSASSRHIELDLLNARQTWWVPNNATIAGLRLDIFAPASLRSGAFGIRRVVATSVDPASCSRHIPVAVDSSQIALARNGCSTNAVSGATFALHAGTHTVTTIWNPTERVSSLVIERGTPVEVSVPAFGSASFREPGLITVPVNGSQSSLVLLAQNYGPGWEAAFTQRDPRGMNVSALWRMVGDPTERLPHVRANGALNGWLSGGGRGWLVFAYLPEHLEKYFALAASIFFVVEMLAIFAVTSAFARKRQ